MCEFRPCKSTRYREVLSSPPSIGVAVSVPTHKRRTFQRCTSTVTQTTSRSGAASHAAHKPCAIRGNRCITHTYEASRPLSPPITYICMEVCIFDTHTQRGRYPPAPQTPTRATSRTLSGSPMELPTPLHKPTYSVERHIRSASCKSPSRGRDAIETCPIV